MRLETENAIRSIATTDPELTKETLEHAIDILRGKAQSEEDIIHSVKYSDAIEILQVSRRTLSYYLDHGYLDRVYGCGCRAIGVSRESLLRFVNRRVVRRSVPQNKNLGKGTPGRKPRKTFVVKQGRKAST